MSSVELAGARLHELLQELLPVSGGRLTLEAVPRGEDGRLAWRDPWGNVRATLRLITWESGREDATRQIQDIREQECVLVGREHEPERSRLELYMRGWVDALRVCFDEQREDCWPMPADFVFPRVLELRRPRAPDHFTRALLVKSRLGRFMRER